MSRITLESAYTALKFERRQSNIPEEQVQPSFVCVMIH